MAVSQRKTMKNSEFMRLHNGDQMKQKEFHFNYEHMPPHYKAELLGGIVFEPSPLSVTHGTSHVELSYLFQTYVLSTVGTHVADNVTTILSPDDEVQPDLFLRILHEYGGQSQRTKEDYINGAPELVAELALTSRSIDLHLKKQRYRVAGVLEYVVVCLRPKRLYWFDLPNDKELSVGPDGVFRSLIFPGLWIHGDGLLQLDHERSIANLDLGLKSAEHKSFVSRLSKSKT